MDAAKLMMLGVVGIGAFAVLRMGKASAQGPQTTDPNAGPGPSPTPSQPGARPSGDGLVFLSDPLSLKQGQWYRGRIQVPAEASGPFSQASSSPELAAALNALGFAPGAQLYMTAEQLPASFPQKAVDGATDRTRWFYAAWSLPSVKLPRPAAIDLMWVAPSPELEARYAAAASAKVSGWPSDYVG